MSTFVGGLGVEDVAQAVAEGAAQINPVRVYWWMILFPAGALAAMLMALNFLGDGLRDVFDPKSTNER